MKLTKLTVGCVSGLGLLLSGTIATAEAAGSSPDFNSSTYHTRVFDKCDDVKNAGIGRIVEGSQLFEMNSKLSHKGKMDKSGRRVACEDHKAIGLYDVTPDGIYRQTKDSRDDIKKGELVFDKNKMNEPTGSDIPDRGAAAVSSSPSASKPSNVPHYADCADAEKKHSGPIPKSDKRYRDDLDKNHNGVACEANTRYVNGHPVVVNGPKVATDYVTSH